MCEKGEFEGNIQIMPSNNNIIKQFIDNVFAKKRHCNKGAFQQIPTAPNVHVYLVVVSIYAIGISVPRDDIFQKFHIQTYF